MSTKCRHCGSTSSNEEIKKLVHEISGNPELIETYAQRVGEFSIEDWLYLLNHRSNSSTIVSRFDKWERLNIDDLCDLLVAHPNLSTSCPDEVLRNFKRIHWAKLIRADHLFSEKFSAMGLKEVLIPDWCCPDHWAEGYTTMTSVRYAAASADEDKIKLIAENSIMNPNFPDGRINSRYANDIPKHIQWLATVASDFAEAAALTDERRATEYALITRAAAYEAGVLRKRIA